MLLSSVSDYYMGCQGPRGAKKEFRLVQSTESISISLRRSMYHTYKEIIRSKTMSMKVEGEVQCSVVKILQQGLQHTQHDVLHLALSIIFSLLELIVGTLPHGAINVRHILDGRHCLQRRRFLRAQPVGATAAVAVA